MTKKPTAAKAQQAKRAPKKTGRRPYAWTEEIEDELFKRIGKGEALRKICADDWLPSVDTVMKRLASGDEAFNERYARAKELQADTIFEQCLEIADDASTDFEVIDGVPQLNREHVQRARLRIDTRRWMAGKLRPKVYGDKLDLTHANPDGTPISKIEVEFVNGPKISDG